MGWCVQETPESKRPPDDRRSLSLIRGTRLDRAADRAQDRADLAAQEDQGNDRDDGDEGEDQRVFGETLAILVPAERGEERAENGHGAVAFLLLSAGEESALGFDLRPVPRSRIDPI